MLYVFVFIMGAIVGSFLNVCIHRLPKSESIVTPLSHCPNCKKNIPWYDNIPILSYIFLGAKCRFCKSSISFRYILVELLTGALFLTFFIAFGLTPKFFAYAVLTSGLIVATFVDFAIQEIPDEVSIGGIITGLLLAFIMPSLFDAPSRLIGLLESGLGVLAGGLSIYLLGLFGEFVFKKEAMGGGDVKLLAMIGAFIGWKLAILTFFIAPFFGSVVGLILKYRFGRETIPYGPYLSLGALVSIFFGEKILKMLFLGFY